MRGERHPDRPPIRRSDLGQWRLPRLVACSVVPCRTPAPS